MADFTSADLDELERLRERVTLKEAEAKRAYTERGDHARALRDVTVAYTLWHHALARRSQALISAAREADRLRVTVDAQTAVIVDLKVEKAGLELDVERLRDLVRHQRGPLHDADLITDAEYAALAGDSGAVARLESYDQMRAALPKWTREDGLWTLRIGALLIGRITDIGDGIRPCVRNDNGERVPLTQADDLEAAAQSICAKLRIGYIPIPEEK